MMPPFETLAAMAAFALATSATPGPVNIVCAMSGAQSGTRRTLPFVSGATFCFVALSLMLGGGLMAGVGRIDRLAVPMTLAGGGYLLWLASRIARHDGTLGAPPVASLPGFWSGVTVQGLNPKAWLVVASALSAFVLPLEYRGAGLAAFAMIFFVTCWASLAVWAWVGAPVPRCQIRHLNRAMALALSLSVCWMLMNVFH
jgi:threonine/homoserine/homoserine lactone efflux protein